MMGHKKEKGRCKYSAITELLIGEENWTYFFMIYIQNKQWKRKKKKKKQRWDIVVFLLVFVIVF